MAKEGLQRQNEHCKILLHPGDEYHGSLQAESLQVLTYLKLANALHNTCTIEERWCYPRTPVLRDGQTNASVSRPLNIILYLQGKTFCVAELLEKTKKNGVLSILGIDTDQNLTLKQRSELVALDALLTDKLRPAVLYLQWLDNDNFLNITREAYAKLLSFPFSLFYISYWYNAKKGFIMRGAASGVTLQERGMEIMARAGRCLSLLSAKLGSSDYYYGGAFPSSHDALVFGYLDILMQLSLSSSLGKNLASHRNLEMFCHRMRRELYPKKKSRRCTKHSSDEEDEESKKWGLVSWLFVGAGVVALAFQGYKLGLFSRFATRNASVL